MPSYRVERAVSGRAGCQDTDCKKHGLKIPQDDLRFGTWVEIQEHGNWRWKHWGCVSGKQLQSVRAALDPEGTGNYDFSMLDGYDSEDRGSLDDYPDLQEKVRRVITQGFIDAEDFNGDPEMNKLGSTGIRTTATKKKLAEDDRNKTHEVDELKAKVTAVEAERDALKADAKKKPSKKRAKEEGSDGEDAFEESKPPPKKRATKAKVKKEEVNDESAAEESKPVPKKHATKPKAKREKVAGEDELAAEVNKPAPKKRATKAKVKKEEDAEVVPTEAKPKPKRGRKSAVKEEVVDEQNGFSDAPEVEVNSKPAAKKGRKKSVKEEPEPEAENAIDEVKLETIDPSSSLSDITTVKNEDPVEEDAEVEDQPKKKGAKAKAKTAKAAATESNSTRAGRIRTASTKDSQ